MSELERNVVAARGGAMFGGQSQLGAFAPHVEVGVAPAVEFAGTAQGLARSAGVGVFAGVMNQHDGQLVVGIDDQELSLQEFGRMLTTYAGWGMRIEFVPDDQLHRRPALEVREPDPESESAEG